MKPDTGESAASIRRRSDNANWPKAREALRQPGVTLFRPPRLRDYFCLAADGTSFNCSLTPARIKKLEKEGVLRHVGVDRYALAEGK